MNDSKLKDALRSYYAADAASPNASARKRTLLLVEAEAARACGGAREADYIPLWRFVASQVRFVRPWAWMLQIALLACMLVLVGEIGPHSGSPIAAPSVFKSFETRVCEMEYSCRFSCVQVLASRLLLFGLADVLWITLAVATVPTLAGIDALRVLLYACTPFFCSCATCFYAARRLPGNSLVASVAPAMSVLAALWLLSATFPLWYEGASLAVWVAALMASMALAALEASRLMRCVSGGLSPHLSKAAL